MGRTGSIAIMLGAVALGGCDGPTGPEGGERVAIAFRGPAATGAAGMTTLQQGISLQTSSGTLFLESVRVIVEEFELEGDDYCREDDARRDDDDDDYDDDCDDFETGPFFVDVPLDDRELVIADGIVPPGTYDELEFEVDDLEDDSRRNNELLADIRGSIPDWPRDASLLVEGTFTPSDGGAARPFRVYFEAEIEIEMDLSPPLVIDDDSRTVAIEVDAERWFRTSSGGVRDLSALDYATTGRVYELEVEFEDGFRSIEFDDDDDDDS